MFTPHASNARRCARHGAATVEFAVIAPLFIAILLGTIEACSMVFLRQTVEMSAYEAARVAVVKQTTSAQVQTAAKSLLDSRNVKDYTITISPANFQSAAYGTFIQVEVRAPCAKNGLIPSIFYGARDVVGTVEMMKEY